MNSGVIRKFKDKRGTAFALSLEKEKRKPGKQGFVDVSFSN